VVSVLKFVYLELFVRHLIFDYYLGQALVLLYIYICVRKINAKSLNANYNLQFIEGDFPHQNYFKCLMYTWRYRRGWGRKGCGRIS